MASIDRLELADVRCFEGVQSARVGRRITLLVGENGAGKSTFLGCYHALARLAGFCYVDEINHFDDPPFRMGGFDSVVRGGKTGFTVGGEFGGHCHDRIALAFEADEEGVPVDRSVELRFRGTDGNLRDLRITRPDEPGVLLRLRESGFSFDFLPGELSFRSVSNWLSRDVRHGRLPFAGELSVFRRQAGGRVGPEREAGFLKLVSLLSGELRFSDARAFRVQAVEPVLPPRRRDYAPAPDHLVATDESELLAFLGEAGRTLGLWTAVRVVRTPGGHGAEVVVDMPGGRLNLMDAGCGVHSLVAIFSAIHNSAPGAVLLLQQPEIHLHPRTQATLAQWMAESGRSFVIETHSAHLVDRFRICVMKGILAPDELAMVYFEPSEDGARSTLHSISVDAQANLVNAPPGYGSFLVTETERLLGLRE